MKPDRSDREPVRHHGRTRGRAHGRVYNGMRAADLGAEGWHKPWSGGNGGTCVEVMKLADGRVAVRQSADPEGPALIYTVGEIEAFVRGAKSGQADFLLN